MRAFEVHTFISLVIFILVHLYANKITLMGWLWHGRFLSFASGVSFAYVFVDLLPAVSAGQPVLKESFQGILPYFDRHAYVIALIGVLFYYGLQRISSKGSDRAYWASLTGYGIFNFFVGASLADPENPDIRPLGLFTIALALHYFVHDHNLREDHPVAYDDRGRWLLSGALFCGWLAGLFIVIPPMVIALVVAFVAGGMLMNVMRYELPQKRAGNYPYFVLGAFIYTVILLRIGVA